MSLTHIKLLFQQWLVIFFKPHSHAYHCSTLSTHSCLINCMLILSILLFKICSQTLCTYLLYYNWYILLPYDYHDYDFKPNFLWICFFDGLCTHIFDDSMSNASWKFLLSRVAFVASLAHLIFCLPNNSWFNWFYLLYTWFGLFPSDNMLLFLTFHNHYNYMCKISSLFR